MCFSTALKCAVFPCDCSDPPLQAISACTSVCYYILSKQNMLRFNTLNTTKSGGCHLSGLCVSEHAGGSVCPSYTPRLLGSSSHCALGLVNRQRVKHKPHPGVFQSCSKHLLWGRDSVKPRKRGGSCSGDEYQRLSPVKLSKVPAVETQLLIVAGSFPPKQWTHLPTREHRASISADQWKKMRSHVSPQMPVRWWEM